MADLDYIQPNRLREDVKDRRRRLLALGLPLLGLMAFINLVLSWMGLIAGHDSIHDFPLPFASPHVNRVSMGTQRGPAGTKAGGNCRSLLPPFGAVEMPPST